MSRRSANDYNDENLFVLGSPFPTVEGITVDAAARKALAGHMTTEIERIIAGPKLYLPYARRWPRRSSTPRRRLRGPGRGYSRVSGICCKVRGRES